MGVTNPPPAAIRRAVVCWTPWLGFGTLTVHLPEVAERGLREPQTIIYLVLFKKMNNKDGEAERWANRSVKYLVDKRGVPRKRVVVLHGGFGQVEMAEIWMAPEGHWVPYVRPRIVLPESTLSDGSGDVRVWSGLTANLH